MILSDSTADGYGPVRQEANDDPLAAQSTPAQLERAGVAADLARADGQTEADLHRTVGAGMDQIDGVGASAEIGPSEFAECERPHRWHRYDRAGIERYGQLDRHLSRCHRGKAKDDHASKSEMENESSHGISLGRGCCAGWRKNPYTSYSPQFVPKQ